jgi:hypothetical protein
MNIKKLTIKLSILVLLTANLCLFLWGILTLINPSFLNHSIKTATVLSNSDIISNNSVYNFVIENIKVIAGFNLSLFLLNMFCIIFGLIEKRKILIILAFAGTYLAYFVPVFLIDLQIGFYGFIEITEILLLMLVFLCGVLYIFNDYFFNKK